MTNGLVEAVCLSSGGDDERSSAWAVGCSYGHRACPQRSMKMRIMNLV